MAAVDSLKTEIEEAVAAKLRNDCRTCQDWSDVAVRPVDCPEHRLGQPSVSPDAPSVIPDTGLTDVEYTLRAIKSAGKGRAEAPRWVHVTALFVVGSTHAHALCRRAGLDPEEVVGVNTWPFRCDCTTDVDDEPQYHF